MKLVNRTMSNLTMLVGGSISSLLVAVILAVSAAKLHIAFFGFSLWLVFPIGAIISGFIAALGYVIGFRNYPYRPSRAIIPCVMAVSVATYFAIYFLVYSFTVIGGRPLSALMPFGRFFDLVVQNAPLSFSGAGTFGSLGFFGYTVAVRDIIGFAIGGFVMCYPIFSRPFCTSCDRLLKTTKTTRWYARTLSSLKQTYEPCRDLLARGDPDGAVQLMWATGGVTKAGAVFELQLLMLQCTKCNLPYYDLSVSQIKPRKEVEDLHIRDRLSSAVRSSI